MSKRRGSLKFVLLPLTFSVLAAACSNGGGNGDASHDYIQPDFSFGDLPPGCPPPAANDKGIGGVCTKGGGECKNGLLCACEPHLNIIPPDNTPCICTQLIVTSGCANVSVDYCGQGAICCSYMDVFGLCVPTVCLENAVCPDLSGTTSGP
jgi:hypothetical protein